MRKYSRIVELLTGIIILSSLVLFVGCSNKNPLESKTPNSNALPSSSISLNPISELVQELDVLVSAPINAIGGGQIDIKNGEKRHKFDVQPGSMSRNAVISVKLEIDLLKGRNALIFEFGPDGLSFRKPAKLTVDMRDVDTAAVNANLYYYDSSMKDWILIEKAAVKNGKATFNIFHFSKYAIEN